MSEIDMANAARETSSIKQAAQQNTATEEPVMLDWQCEHRGRQAGIRVIYAALKKLRDNERKKLQNKRTDGDDGKRQAAFGEYSEVMRQTDRFLYLIEGRADDLGMKLEA